jgi:hypothetical protein
LRVLGLGGLAPRWPTWLVVLVASVAGVLASAAHASNQQEGMLQADASLMADPTGTLSRLRLLGVQRIRLAVRWQYIAPSPNSRLMPSHFDATDPAAYPAANWKLWDRLVTDTSQAGIPLDFDVMGGAPKWALGPGEPSGADNLDWQVNPVMYEEFVEALGIRYSGQYDPKLKRIARGDPNDLPRVSFWSVWNEPDYGPSLAPQGVPGHLGVANSPRLYRNLVDAAWTALHRTGHGSDAFIFGELAPRGMPFWGVFSGMKPLPFLRALYCVDSRYRPYRGGGAAIRGCPTTAAGSRAFRSRNPALFQATGISDHPYMRWYPPNREAEPDPDYSTLAEIGNLERAVDRLQSVYGSHARLGIWNTEFGYLTSPPKRDNQPDAFGHRYPWVSQATAAYYINWAEYISWRNPRIQSFMQYLLDDPLPATKATYWGGYASGLVNYSGAPKPGYNAWRLPLYLPVTKTGAGRSLEVWGCARPAHYALLDTSEPQPVQIQFKPRSGGPFQTMTTVLINNPRQSCYFDVRVAFPSSGTVRLAWPYPTLDLTLGNFALDDPSVAYSRPVQITLG